MKLSIGQRLLVASLLVSVLLVAVGLVAYLSVRSISTDAQAVARIAQEHDQFVELQLFLVKTLIPPGEYLISGDPAQRTNFQDHLAAVEAGMQALRRSTMLSGPLADVPARLVTIEGLGWRILALPVPVGSPEGASLMASLDRAGHDLVTEMDRLHEVHKAAMSIAVARQERTRQEAVGILLGAAAATTVMVLSSGLLLSRSITRPVVALQRGAEIVGGGDLTYRLRVNGDDEIGQLARKFNAMADRLAESHATLEERVAERTRELSEANRELHAYHRVQQEMLARIISVQEEERRRIARELHDETGQAIATLSVNLDFLKSTVTDDRLRERLSKLRAITDETLEEIHKVVFDLRPRILDDLGLAPAIAGYLESHLAPLGIQVAFEAHGFDRRLPAAVETGSFRIVQEAITNVIRHARARHVQVCLDFNGAVLAMFVEDDGIGFEPQEALKVEGGGRAFGLLGIRERGALLGGTVEIHSRPGQGARLYVEIPVEPT